MHLNCDNLLDKFRWDLDGGGQPGKGRRVPSPGGGRGANWGEQIITGPHAAQLAVARVVPVVALCAWRSRRVGCLGWLLGGWGAGVLVVRGLAVVSVCNGRLSFNLV